MAQKRNADVIVPVVRGDLAILGRLQKILDVSGPTLGRLLLIDDGCSDLDLAEGLAELVATEPRLHHLRCARNLGWVERCNRGLAARRGDAVVVYAETVVTERWLAGLADAAHSEERTALAAAVGVDADDLDIDEAGVRRAVEGLAPWTSTPRAGIGCNYLRGDVLDAVGLLDPRFKTASAALDDWLMRARSLGFFAKRANHVFVFCGEDREAGSKSGDGATLHAKHEHLARQVDRFERSLDASLVRHAIEYQASGRLRVAYDVRHLPLEQNGTKMYAISLGKALAAIPEIDLTLLAAHPIQAEGVPGRIVSPDEWADDVSVIHKPAQIFDRRHAKLLFESKAHVVVTYQDLIAYRLPGVFATEDDYNTYQNTSRLTLQAVQGILAYSRCTAREIADEFGIPIDEISPIFLGVDVDAFAAPVAEAEEIRARLDLPPRYFLSLASDYPHKNLAGLLEAYALFRQWWREDEPPALALAGNAPRTAAGVHDQPGVSFLGSVSDHELKVLYQNAEALVFPSVYEGFGLPPLEAMATGSPVVAMPFSSVPEVCGDAALYSDGLSPIDLARAMQRLAIDEDLRTELTERGRQRIEALHWQATARATFEVYRKAVTNPSIRSLQMRRSLQEAIALWAEPAPVVVAPAPPPEVQVVHVVQEPEPLGIFNACNDLNIAVRRRLKRELKRLAGRRSA
ncbi:glycosyltransferase [Paludisphaera borealis]|uniref:GT2 and GT4 families glycosyltransferase n=1 Tax=Paludisphaera borealis TaxID=1387353 RepID=A0A1U7CMT8_9BACT|nr:glycosyltransferase [Paludisphaera borealis]APW60255.1 GT2 and GT4 families glycosyltransferase [Paludisphaera borealis]